MSKRFASLMPIPFAAFLASLAGCAAGTMPQQTMAAGSNLTGNWLLAGTLPPAGISLSNTSFGLAADFNVTGTQILGAVNAAEVCNPGLSLEGPVTGNEAADGSFVLTFLTVPNANLPTITITGTVPEQAGAEWSGTYTITNPTKSACPASVAGAIHAVSVPLLAGSYTGGVNLVFAGSTKPEPVTAEITLQQGEAARGDLALQGTVQLPGASCLTSGTTNGAQTPLGTPSTSSVQGNEIAASFLMNDGSTLELLGAISALDASMVNGSLFTLVKGTCPLLSATPVSLNH